MASALVEGGSVPRDKHHHIMDYLASLRFPVARERSTVTGVAALLEYHREIWVKREHLPYDIDGTVYKVNDLAQQEKARVCFPRSPVCPRA